MHRLLTSLSCWLALRQKRTPEIVGDMESVCWIALRLSPQHHPARANLAFLYCETGRSKEAAEQAKRALIDMDAEEERGNDMPEWLQKALEERSPGRQYAYGNLREVLLRIAEGRPPRDIFSFISEKAVGSSRSAAR